MPEKYEFEQIIKAGYKHDAFENIFDNVIRVRRVCLWQSRCMIAVRRNQSVKISKRFLIKET